MQVKHIDYKSSMRKQNRQRKRALGLFLLVLVYVVQLERFSIEYKSNLHWFY